MRQVAEPSPQPKIFLQRRIAGFAQGFAAEDIVGRGIVGIESIIPVLAKAAHPVSG
jgi:ethanolamine transporter EutH